MLRSGRVLVAATGPTIRLRLGFLRRCVIGAGIIAQALTIALPLTAGIALAHRGPLSLTAIGAKPRSGVRALAALATGLQGGTLPLTATIALAHRGPLSPIAIGAKPRSGVRALAALITGLQRGTLDLTTTIALAHRGPLSLTAIAAKARSGLLAGAASIARAQGAALALSHAAAVAKARSGLRAGAASIARSQGAPLTRAIIETRSITEALSIAVRGPRGEPAVAWAIDAGHEPVVLHHRSVAFAARRIGPQSALRRRALGSEGAGCKKSHQGSHGYGQLHHRCTPSEWPC